MNIASSAFFGAALVCYFLASVCYLAQLFLKHPRLRGVATAISFVGVAFHSVQLMLRVSHASGSAFSTDAEGWSFLSWAVAAIYLAIGVKPRLGGVGAFAMPAALVCMLVAAARGGGGPYPLLQHVPLWGLALHVPASVLSIAAFSLAFACAVCYLIQDRLLKEKRLTGLFRALPPLDVLDSTSYWLVVIGFCLLSVGMVTGAILASDAWTNSWFSHPKTLASVLLWITYAVYLATRGLGNWRGRRVHMMVVIAVASLLMLYALASLLLPVPPTHTVAQLSSSYGSAAG